MLENETKKRAYAQRKKAVEQHDGAAQFVQAECERLYQTRIQAFELIERVEAFYNSITYAPLKFEPHLERIHIEFINFRQPKEYDAEVKKEAAILSGGVAAGTAVGTGIAKLGPRVVMWVVAKVGKASTGIPISKLSGNARKNAIKALIGGGPLASGGGGIKVGQALLNSAVPVGVGFTVVGISGTLIALAVENNNTVKEAVKEANAARIDEERLMEACAAVSRLQSKTEDLLGRVSEQLKSLEPLKDCNYAERSVDEKLQLESLIKDTLALTGMLNKVVE